MRTSVDVTFDVPPQEILTRDSVTVSVDAVVYFRIFNPIISVTNVANPRVSTQLLAATTLRNILGTKTLQEILTDRENISHLMQTHLDEGTEPWGVKVERVEMKDVRLPANMQRSMAAEAEGQNLFYFFVFLLNNEILFIVVATREAHAKVISAEGEKKSNQQME
ncbi:unnamed protein product [Rotaria sp. Silwood2]|nr:unnamed protein product [Rotaria sp. Silwood2]